MKLAQWLLFVMLVGSAFILSAAPTPLKIKATVLCDVAHGNPECSWNVDEAQFSKIFGKAAAENYEAFQATNFSNETAAIKMLTDSTFLQAAKKSKCQYAAEVVMIISHPKVKNDAEGLPIGLVNIDSIASWVSGFKLSPKATEQAMYGFNQCRPVPIG
jgi:hypothetical protein